MTRSHVGAPDGMSGAPFFDAVVFDCDGVLVDSESLSAVVSQRVFADLGWNVDLDTVTSRFTGCSQEFLVAELEKNLGRRLPAGWFAPYRHWLDEALRDGVQSIEGVSAALDAIRLPIAVASNSDHARIRLSLEAAGLLPKFEGCIASAEDVRRGKPAPDVYLRAAEMLRVPPERCIAIDDSSFGVNAALAAGMRVLAYRTEAPRIESRQKATRFERMAQLPRLIEELRTTGGLSDAPA